MKGLFLVPFPSILIGSLVMYMNGVSIFIWSQNIFGSLIAVLLSDLGITSLVILPLPGLSTLSLIYFWTIIFGERSKKVTGDFYRVISFIR